MVLPRRLLWFLMVLTMTMLMWLFWMGPAPAADAGIQKSTLTMKGMSKNMKLPRETEVWNTKSKIPRLFCWTPTLYTNQGKGAIGAKHIWPQKCDMYKRFVNTTLAMRSIYNHNLNDYDWFLFANDDTFVLVDDLRKYLGDFHESNVMHYFGYAWPGLLKTGHKAGFIISRYAVKLMAEIGLANKTLCPDNVGLSEESVQNDIDVRFCLQSMGVFIAGLDSVVHNVFLPYRTLNATEKLIVTWTTWFGHDLAAIADQFSANCPFKCRISADTSLAERAHALLFHYHYYSPIESLPSVRHSWQRYILFMLESPLQIRGLDSYSSLFNWSMSYHSASDIFDDFYGRIEARMRSTVNEEHVQKIVKGKTKMVAWLVSHCNTDSAREYYVAELQKHVSVDQFGTCPWWGWLWWRKCPKGSEDNECISKLTTNYRFYLSFENSVCTDYVTEKFFSALQRLMVPIVLRGKDYAGIAPEGSYIAADQFRSPKHLAEYLHYLTKNEAAYLKYFEWTKRFAVSRNRMPMRDSFCRLCRMLHENRTTTTFIEDANRWWIEQNACVADFAKQLL